MKLLLASLLMAACGCFEAAGAGAASRPQPPAMTPEEKVLASDFVVVGSVVDIICVEKRPGTPRDVEIDQKRCNDDWARGAHWVARLDRLLCSKLPQEPYVFVRIEPATELRTVRQQREHYLGRGTIFFLQEVADRDGTAVYRFAMGRRIAFPQAASTLTELAPVLARHRHCGA
jgi:hypothetical protein